MSQPYFPPTITRIGPPPPPNRLVVYSGGETAVYQAVPSSRPIPKPAKPYSERSEGSQKRIRAAWKRLNRQNPNYTWQQARNDVASGRWRPYAKDADRRVPERLYQPAPFDRTLHNDDGSIRVPGPVLASLSTKDIKLLADNKEGLMVSYLYERFQLTQDSNDWHAYVEAERAQRTRTYAQRRELWTREQFIMYLQATYEGQREVARRDSETEVALIAMGTTPPETSWAYYH